MVTVAVQVAVLLLASVAVKVTVFDPVALQSKLVWLKAKVKEQLSALPLSISVVAIVAFPLPSRSTVMS